MKEIGAEAEITLENGFILKKRIVKKYREPQLDLRIRRERNKKEARLLVKASQKVNVPKIIDTSEFSIKMEFIKGIKLKDKENLKGLEKRMGEQIGLLHSLKIFHGDLTTSNILLKKDEIYLIDFGLADRGKIEDFATDLKVLFECVKASHTGFSETSFFEGYSKQMLEHNQVFTRLKKVYERGRYRIKSSQ